MKRIYVCACERGAISPHTNKECTDDELFALGLSCTSPIYTVEDNYDEKEIIERFKKENSIPSYWKIEIFECK